jgi:hypothetical protein
LADSGRTELSKAFAAWLLREPETNCEFASIVNDAAARQGAQQDFQTVAILGFAAEAGVLNTAQVEVLKNGIRRQAGRKPVVDGLEPMAFCSDPVGILGVLLGTKAVADVDITSQVVGWTSKFLRNSYEMDRTEDWQRSLLAVADRQLGSSLNLLIPNSPATADIRIALAARGVIDDDPNRVAEDRTQTLKLAVREPQDELNSDRAALRLAAIEWVLGTAEPTVKGKNGVRSAKQTGPLSERDIRVHDTVSKERFCTLTNAEIMKEASVKKRLWADFRLKAGSDAAKRCLDRIRQAKRYPLSREIVKKRSTRQ